MGKILPKWLKPELDDWKYWAHVVILAAVVLGVLQLWKGGEMLTLWNVVVSVPILVLGDVVAHTLMQVD